jgi:hypothetical protein
MAETNEVLGQSDKRLMIVRTDRGTRPPRVIRVHVEMKRAGARQELSDLMMMLLAHHENCIHPTFYELADLMILLI